METSNKQYGALVEFIITCPPYRLIANELNSYHYDTPMLLTLPINSFTALELSSRLENSLKKTYLRLEFLAHRSNAEIAANPPRITSLVVLWRSAYRMVKQTSGI